MAERNIHRGADQGKRQNRVMPVLSCSVLGSASNNPKGLIPIPIIDGPFSPYILEFREENRTYLQLLSLVEKVDTVFDAMLQLQNPYLCMSYFDF